MKRRAATVHHRARVLRYDPRRRAWLILGGGVGVVVLVIAAFLSGGWRQARGVAPLAAQNAALETRLERSERAREAAEQQLATLGKGALIDTAATDQLRSEFAAARERIVRLEQEVALYQSLMDSSVRTQGLVLQSWALRPAAKENTWSFSLTLLQRAQRYAPQTGTLTLSVSGTLGGKSRTLALSDLMPDSSLQRLPVAFMYFEVVDGELQLPAGFVPQQVRVQVQLTGRNGPRLDKTLPWKPEEH